MILLYSILGQASVESHDILQEHMIIQILQLKGYIAIGDNYTL